MRMKRLLPLLLIASMITQSLETKASTVSFTLSTDTTSLVAGVVNEINVTIENNGSYPVHPVQARITSATPGVTVVGVSTIDIERMEASSSYSFELSLLVSRNLYGSAASLTIYLNYGDPITRIQSVDTFTLSYVVSSESYLEPVSLDRVGREVSLTLGNPSPIQLSNASVRLEYGGVLVGLPYSIKMDSVNPQGNITLSFDLAGFYDQVTIAVTYSDGWTDRYTVKLPGLAHDVVVESVERRGEIVTIGLINIGEGDEEDVTVSLKYMGAVAGLPYEINVPLLKAGETKTVSFQLPRAYQQITLSIEYSDGFVDERTYSISVFGGSLVELRCTYPERRAELGTIVYYPLTVINRGLSGVFELSIVGLHSVFKWSFLRDNTEVQAVYLEEGEQAIVALSVEVPEIPLNFTLDERISFNLTATSEGDILEELEVGLTPTTTGSLEIYSKGWYGEAIAGVQGLHYTGIPYSTSLLSKGSTVSAKYWLEKGKTYIILLYGPFVGSMSDLNLYLLDVNGGLLAVSADGQGNPETLTATIHEAGLYLLVVSNEETTSRSVGEGVLLVSELQPAPGTITVQLQPPLFETSTIINVTNLQGNKVHLNVVGENLSALLYPFTSNRDRTKYDPFIPKALVSVKSANGTAELEYPVMRGDELILVQWKTSQLCSLTVESTVYEYMDAITTLLEQDLVYLAAVLATVGLITVAIWGEKKLLPRSLS